MKLANKALVLRYTATTQHIIQEDEEASSILYYVLSWRSALGRADPHTKGRKLPPPPGATITESIS